PCASVVNWLSLFAVLRVETSARRTAMTPAVDCWPLAVRLAGAGQLALAAGSLAIPRILRWSEDTAKLRPLTRQIFWVYAAYILSFHVAFGLLSVLAPHWLLDGSPLAGAV